MRKGIAASQSTVKFKNISSIGNRHSRHKHVFRKLVFAPIGLALEGIGKSRFLPVFSVSRMTGGVQKVTVILGTEEEKKICVFERRYFYSTAYRASPLAPATDLFVLEVPEFVFLRWSVRIKWVSEAGKFVLCVHE